MSHPGIQQQSSNGIPASNTAADQRWMTVGTMYYGYAMFMVLRMIPTVTGAAMRKEPALQIDLEVWGRILAIGTCGAIVGKFVGGWAADTFGGKRTFTVGLLCSSVFVGLFAASTAVWMFQVTFFVTLLAKSAGWPSMAKIIPNWFTSNEYGRVWGVLSTSSRVGTLIATFCLGALLAYLPWRWILVASAIAGALAAVAFACLLKERPRATVRGIDSHSAAATAPHPLDRLSLTEALQRFAVSRQFWLITGSLMGLTILWDFLLMVPMFLEDTLALPMNQASMAASAFPFGSLISVLCGGYVFDRLSRAAAARLFGLLLLLATGCIGTFLVLPQFGLSTTAATYLSLVLLFVFGVCVSPCYYIPMSVFSIEFGGPRSGFLISLLDALAFGASALFYYHAGAWAERDWGLFLSVLLAVCAWSLCMTILFLRGEAGRQTAADS